MSENFKILAEFIKDMSSETPNAETFLYVKEYLGNYNLKIDISSKPLKNRMIEIITKMNYMDNGKSKNNLDHETFVLTKNFREPFYNGDDVKFNFCKTARKPYDLAVWHLLTFVKMIAPNSIDIKRDGWYNGRKEIK